MAIAFRNAQSASDADTSSVTITKPTGVVSGDALVMFLSFQDNSARTFTLPSGFSLIRTTSGISSGTISSFIKVAGGSEPANYATSWVFSDAVVGLMLAYSGVNTSTPIDAHNGTYNSATGANIVCPSVSAVSLETMLVCLYGSAFAGTGAAATWTPPAGMTERVDQDSSGTEKLTGGAADQLLAASGPTGTRTATLSDSTHYTGGQLITLTPSVVTLSVVPRVGMIGI